MLIENLYKQKLITPPKWMLDNTHYLCMMGSIAYGVDQDNSDVDVYGFCIPPKRVLFPWTVGILPDFDRDYEKFDQYQHHHIKTDIREYDLSVYSIVKYFTLCVDNNPNMIDSLFVPIDCILHVTKIGQTVLDNRKLFLSKNVYHRFRGYAHSQLNKAQNRINTYEMKELYLFEKDHNISHNTTYEQAKQIPLFEEDKEKYLELWEAGLSTSKRFEISKVRGYDVKFAYHLVRLLLECEQILETGDLDLRKHSAYLKDIRNNVNSIDLEQVQEIFNVKMKYLDKLYETTELPYSPDRQRIKELLIFCLELVYGNFMDMKISTTHTVDQLIQDLDSVLAKYKN